VPFAGPEVGASSDASLELQDGSVAMLDPLHKEAGAGKIFGSDPASYDLTSIRLYHDLLSFGNTMEAWDKVCPRNWRQGL
jgi:hypothetical protein